MSELTIKDMTKEVTAWSKEITFEREGETYLATLYWGLDQGYDITFHNKTNSTPEWAQKLIDIDTGDENLYEILDNLTEGESNE
jgi:hypothetical protein